MMYVLDSIKSKKKAIRIKSVRFKAVHYLIRKIPQNMCKLNSLSSFQILFSIVQCAYVVKTTFIHPSPIYKAFAISNQFVSICNEIVFVLHQAFTTIVHAVQNSAFHSLQRISVEHDCSIVVLAISQLHMFHEIVLAA